jgi:hypothetical protein
MKPMLLRVAEARPIVWVPTYSRDCVKTPVAHCENAFLVDSNLPGRSEFNSGARNEARFWGTLDTSAFSHSLSQIQSLSLLKSLPRIGHSRPTTGCAATSVGNRPNAAIDHVLFGAGELTSMIELSKVARVSITCYVRRHGLRF